MKTANKTRLTEIEVNGRKGIIHHDILCADGPKDENGDPILGEDGEPLPGANDDMAMIMRNTYYAFMCQSVYKNIKDSNGNTKSTLVPRFGILTMLAENTPIIVYDHPAFKEIANTAFTDGNHIFVDADFMRKLMNQEIDSNQTESGVVFLLLHELMHKLYLHVDRLKGFDPRMANIAEDYVINGKLVTNFGLLPVPLLRETGVGMTPEDANKYSSLSEETVAEMLLQKERQRNKNKKDGEEEGDENGNDGGPSQSQSGSGQGQGKGKGKGKGEKGGKGGQGGEDSEGEPTDDDGNEYSPIHHISQKELSEILEREGLSESVGDRLNIPKPHDVEGLAKKKEKGKMQITDAIQNAIAENGRLNGQMPGGHIAEEAAMLIDGLNKGSLTWKMKIQEVVLGGGMKESRSEEMPNDMFFLDDNALGPAELGLNQIYLPGRVPAQSDEVVLMLVDSSGSTGMDGMREAFISEAVGMQDASVNNETAKEVIIWSADTRLRGEPQSITRANMQEFLKSGVKMFGNGGTDFARCLHDAVNHPLMKRKKITNVIYFTDCCDNPPNRADYAEFLDNGGKLTWITTPGMWNEAFNKGVEGWSSVYVIERGTVVDLDRKEEIKNTRSGRV